MNALHSLSIDMRHLSSSGTPRLSKMHNSLLADTGEQSNDFNQSAYLLAEPAA